MKASEMRGHIGGLLSVVDVEELLKRPPVNLTIQSVATEKIGRGDKEKTELVLSFIEIRKKLVVNKTRLEEIAKLFGDEDVKGKRISLALARTPTGIQYVSVQPVK